jgi:hypothetical protein
MSGQFLGRVPKVDKNLLPQIEPKPPLPVLLGWIQGKLGRKAENPIKCGEALLAIENVGDRTTRSLWNIDGAYLLEAPYGHARVPKEQAAYWVALLDAVEQVTHVFRLPDEWALEVRDAQPAGAKFVEQILGERNFRFDDGGR